VCAKALGAAQRKAYCAFCLEALIVAMVARRGVFCCLRIFRAGDLLPMRISGGTAATGKRECFARVLGDGRFGGVVSARPGGGDRPEIEALRHEAGG